MQKAYFMSDAHLGSGSKEETDLRETRVVKFFDAISRDASHIFIVGDLFDAWFEYRTVIPKGYHRILSKLDDLVRRNIKVYYLLGNHDYWAHGFFQNDLGIEVHRDAFEVTLNGKRILIHHGDGLATNDTGYRILKKILRNPFAMWLYSWLHPDIGISIARFFSGQSRQYTSDKRYGEEDGMVKYATEKIREGVDIVIMGHRHVPSTREIGRGIYINLGDWIDHCTYAELTEGNIALKTWTA